jgi:hypothetical protein
VLSGRPFLPCVFKRARFPKKKKTNKNLTIRQRLRHTNSIPNCGGSNPKEKKDISKRMAKRDLIPSPDAS